MDVLFRSVRELVERAETEGKLISELMIEQEMLISGRAREEIFTQMDRNLTVMEEAVEKGDSNIQEIMAASILAKVSRDRYMLKMAEIYPQYNFTKHKGYPTAEHRNAIKEFGVSPIHRKTFGGVKEFL